MSTSAEPILGVHVGRTMKLPDNKTASKDISDAILKTVEELNINAVQIFTHGPRNIIPNKIDYPALVAATSDIDLTVHSTYNSTKVWSIQPDTVDSKSSQDTLTAFKSQMLSCKKANAWGLVLHVTKQYPDIVNNTMQILKPIAKKSGVKIILEMVACYSAADQTYETPEKITNLTTLIGPNEPWWGWCIDTAHLWSLGIDVRSYESMKKWFDSLIYKKKIVQFHLNGSCQKFNGGKDGHEIAFSDADVIWKGVDPKKSGVRALVEFAMDHSCPIICEIDYEKTGDDIKDSLATIKQLANDYHQKKLLDMKSIDTLD